MSIDSLRPSGGVFDRLARTVHQSFVRGVALTVPLLVTLLVFGFAVKSLARIVAPVVEGVSFLVGVGDAPKPLLELLALLVLVLFVLVVGFVAERRSGGESRIAATVDNLISGIPGLGSVYTGVQRLSDVLLSDDTDSFREVKLLEFPDDGSYMLCYLTATPPPTIREGAGIDEMVTLFVPMAPNPVMGGFLVHARADRVHDVDMTVEEGMQAIITSGVAVDPHASHGSEADAPDPVGDGRPT
ncbi:MAG: DUF502 domain-containing protein [Haloferacaceae archaeon]